MVSSSDLSVATAPPAASERLNLRGLSAAELSGFIQAEGLSSFRAVQIARWIHLRGAEDFSAMSDLSKALRARLAERAVLHSLQTTRVERATDGTRKYAFTSAHGDIIEAVYIPDASSEGRNTLCISSQVGCAVDCKFCLTASLGLRRNLDAGEMVEQITRAKQSLAAEGIEPRIGNLVFMGMGEPLHNYRQLVSALEWIASDRSHKISPRRITVSTSGVVSHIPRLGRDTSVNLAVSLNASTDAQRDALMPINKRWNIQALLGACRAFPLKQRRRITFEYVLLDGVNDSEADARRLSKLLRGIRCKLNLIPFNPHAYSPFAAPRPEAVARFKEIVGKSGIGSFVRSSRGDEISAACGQLGAEVEGPRKRLPVLS